MANGYGRDLDRLIATLEGFRAVHGCWPTRVRSSKAFIASLRSILTEKGYQQLSSKVVLISRSSGITAEDDCGHKYSYGDHVQDWSKRADIEAWLGYLEYHPCDDNDGMVFLTDAESATPNLVETDESSM
jgi:hypothetical protein